MERVWKACGRAAQAIGRLETAVGIETGMPATLPAAPKSLGGVAANSAPFSPPPACCFDRDKVLSLYLDPPPEKRANPAPINPIF